MASDDIVDDFYCNLILSLCCQLLHSESYLGPICCGFMGFSSQPRAT